MKSPGLLFKVILLLCLIIANSCRKKIPVQPTPQSNIPSQFQMRVLLLNDIRSCTLKIDPPFNIYDSLTSVSQSYPLSREQLSVPMNINISAGKITIAGQSFQGNDLVIAPDDSSFFNLNGDKYRGKLRLLLNSDPNSFDAINIVPLEPYLAGVIGVEMHSYWEPAALEAQTIAARTYCLYIKKRFGEKRSWDIKKTQAHQAYNGIKAESASVWQAIDNTWGQVLFCDQKDGSKDIFPAYYGSVCGGHTENSKNVFGGETFAPLAGVPCTYCLETAKPGIFSWSDVEFSKADIKTKLLQSYQSLSQIGDINEIVPLRQSDYNDFSRLTMIKLVGTDGNSINLRAEDFRLAIDSSGSIIKSAACKIADHGDKWAFWDGRGYGHAVGLCQYGAEALARKGMNAQQILRYYYPDSWIENIYSK